MARRGRRRLWHAQQQRGAMPSGFLRRGTAGQAPEIVAVASALDPAAAFTCVAAAVACPRFVALTYLLSHDSSVASSSCLTLARLRLSAHDALAIHRRCCGPSSLRPRIWRPGHFGRSRIESHPTCITVLLGFNFAIAKFI